MRVADERDLRGVGGGWKQHRRETDDGKTTTEGKLHRAHS
jgi:hypothetical protein